MNKKRLIFGIGVIGIIIIITIATVIKIKDNKLEEKYKFIIDNFVYYSKKCVLEEKCKNNTVTLQELYDNNYLEKQINPKTKKEFNENSYIKILDYDFVLIK